jgi:DNA-binding NtrC family response regulator
MSKGRILIIDDQISLLTVVEIGLKQRDYEVRTASSGKEGLEILDEFSPEVIVLDLMMPEMDGLETLDAILEIDPLAVVVMLTAHATVQSAVAAIKKGAYDYVQKPSSPEQMDQLLERAVDHRRLLQENRRLQEELQFHVGGELVGDTPVMKKVYQQIAQVAPADTTVLIVGESGTGKELVARAIHQASPRADRPLVTVHAGAISEDLLESELFGHEKGAFTGAHQRKIGQIEVADKGTFFLDEIGDAPQKIQVKLLRVLQEKEFVRVGSTKPISVDVRFIAATHQDLQQLVQEGRFREDLYYRLNVFPVNLPPLRDRWEDIPRLARHFVKRYSRHLGRKVSDFDPAALAAVQNYRFPGNVRELENGIERAVLVASGDTITLDDLPHQWTQGSGTVPDPNVPFQTTGDITYKETRSRLVESFDRGYLTNLLKQHRGNVTHCARAAGLDRSNFQKLLRKYQISAAEFRKPPPGGSGGAKR